MISFTYILRFEVLFANARAVCYFEVFSTDKFRPRFPAFWLPILVMGTLWVEIGAIFGNVGNVYRADFIISLRSNIVFT